MNKAQTPSGEAPLKRNGVQVFVEEVTAGPPKHITGWRRIGRTLLIPVLAILSGLVMGGVFIILTSP